jgi:DNA-binding PadR family transcriptional regulator
MLTMLLPGPKHGYQLKHEAGLIVGQVLHNNLVYPLLRQFTDKKWVRQKVVPGERGQTRNQYSLTALGRKELRDRLSRFTAQDARSAEAFVLRVGMFWFLEPDIRQQILQARGEFLRRRISTLTNVENNFPLNRYAQEVTTHMRAEAESEISWIERLRRLEKSKKENSHE